MAFILSKFSDAINESEINLYTYDGDRPSILEGSGEGSISSSGAASAFFGRDFVGSGVVYASGVASADISTFIRVQIMHTERTLYIEEDDRYLDINLEERELEIDTEYTELDVPAVATFYQ